MCVCVCACVCVCVCIRYSCYVFCNSLHGAQECSVSEILVQVSLFISVLVPLVPDPSPLPFLSRNESTLVLKTQLISALNFAQYGITFVVLPWIAFTAHGGIGRQPAPRSVFILLSLRQPLLYFAVLVVMESMVLIAAGRVSMARIKVRLLAGKEAAAVVLPVVRCHQGHRLRSEAV